MNATHPYPMQKGALARAKGVVGCLRRLLADQTGATALEFALVAPAFIALLLAALHTALIYLVREGLETAAESAGRLIMTGQAQTMVLGSGGSAYTGMSASDFKTAICNGISGKDVNGNTVSYPSSLPPFLVCSRLYVNVEVVPAGCTTPSLATPTFTYNGNTLTSSGTGYGTVTCGSTTNSNGGLSGTQQQLVILQLLYLWPTVSGPLGLNFVNQPGGNVLLSSASVFTVEKYSCASGSTSC